MTGDLPAAGADLVLRGGRFGQGHPVVMAVVMVVIIALLFKAEDWFGRDVEG